MRAISGWASDAAFEGTRRWGDGTLVTSGGIGVAYRWKDVNPADSLYFVVEWDYIQGTSGADTINRTGGETVYGLEGNDIITFTSGANDLRGDAGDDSVSGGSGVDDINGKMGNGDQVILVGVTLTSLGSRWIL